MSIKNRFYPAEKVGYVDIDYVNGINVFSGMMEIALEAGIIVQGGSWFSYKGENVAQGLTKATQVVLADPVLKKSILDEINEYLQTTGFSSAVDEKMSKDIKLMAESITS